MRNKLILLTIVPIIFLAGCIRTFQLSRGITTEFVETFNEMKPTVALRIADNIKNLPTFNFTHIDNYQEAYEFVSSVNMIIDLLNKNFGTEFSKIEIEEVKNVIKFVEKYSPIVEPYNNLIISARKLNLNDSHSINKFYINAFLLASDVFLIKFDVMHKTTFGLVGILNNRLKIVKIKSEFFFIL